MLPSIFVAAIPSPHCSGWHRPKTWFAATWRRPRYAKDGPSSCRTEQASSCQWICETFSTVVDAQAFWTSHPDTSSGSKNPTVRNLGGYTLMQLLAPTTPAPGLWLNKGLNPSVVKISRELFSRSQRNSPTPCRRKALALVVWKLVPSGDQQLQIGSPASRTLAWQLLIKIAGNAVNGRNG